MGQAQSKGKAQRSHRRKKPEDIRALSRQILHRANRNAPRVDFIHEVSMMLMKFSECDALELWLKEDEDYFRSRIVLCQAGCYHFLVLPKLPSGDMKSFAHSPFETNVAKLGWDLIHRRFDSSAPGFTTNGSFWTGDVERDEHIFATPNPAENPGIAEGYRSLALMPLMISQLTIGLLQLKSRQRDFFTQREIERYEEVVEILSVTLLNQRARAACRERVKELTCLYSIVKAEEKLSGHLGEFLQGIAELLPPAWQYPEIACARILVDGRAYTTPGFSDDHQRQSADILVGEQKRGVVEVIYLENKPELDEGPFLKEERILINSIATQISMIIEQQEAEEDKTRLEGQLRHADRLATIGQLAAGVAHELNEPLGNILGFAQLVQKGLEVPAQTRSDIGKIVAASLHAREIVNKLKLFARQSPPQKIQLDLNKLIDEGLVFLESRCTKAGIELVRCLAADLPTITADKGQLHQVLVNLVVNSIQAMPQGGKLTISTAADTEQVLMIVEDTGTGMSQEVMKRIFIPFFTTKDVNEGTGLGLAVVDGIVSSHGGSIKVQSEVGRGTRFEVQLPREGGAKIQEEELG